MKRTIALGIAVLAIVTFCWIMTPMPASAADEQITFKPASVTELKDRNGNSYVRMLWAKTGELNGVSYSKTVSVNAYGEHVAQARAIKPGQEVKAVASKKFYQGSEYYTILGFDGKSSTAKK